MKRLALPLFAALALSVVPRSAAAHPRFRVRVDLGAPYRYYRPSYEAPVYVASTYVAPTYVAPYYVPSGYPVYATAPVYTYRTYRPAPVVYRSWHRHRARCWH